MLSKNSRADKKTLEKVFKNGKFINSQNLTLRFIKENNGLPPKISFISPKSSSKKAVIRNLLRRRGYTALRKHIDLIPLGITGAFMFGPKSAAVFSGKAIKPKESIEILDKELQVILKKLK